MKGIPMFGKEFLRSLNNLEKATNTEKKSVQAASAKPILYLILKYNAPAKRA